MATNQQTGFTRTGKMSRDISDTTCCIVDAGSFVPLAACMAEKCAKTWYYSPYEQEFLGIERCCIGDGSESFDRIDEFLEPKVLDQIDLFVFPDIGFGGLQRHLKSLDKLVWGSMGASDLELYRTRFLKVLEEAGLPVVQSVKCVGLTALAEHLKEVQNKWVKINRYRDNMETWHHLDWDHSQRQLEHLALVFGPMKEHVVFVVQDAINGDDDSPVIEIGYDGWMVTSPDGEPQFPSSSFQGYELKNKLYLGSQLDATELPEEVIFVNEKIAPFLAQYGYRNFWATEIRVKDKVPYFIDPTARMAGQTMEHLLNTCTNLPEVILAGAEGRILEPEFESPFAAEATLHYTQENDGWKTFVCPKEVEPYVKLYRYCFVDGAYQFPPHKLDELGVILGSGETIEESIDDLKDHFELLKDSPVSIDVSGFADLLKQIQEAEDEGVEFTDQTVPEPSVVLDH